MKKNNNRYRFPFSKFYLQKWLPNTEISLKITKQNIEYILKFLNFETTFHISRYVWITGVNLFTHSSIF